MDPALLHCGAIEFDAQAGYSSTMSAHSSTVKTMAGFFRAVLGRWLPFLAKSQQLTDIYNYLPIDGLFATSGQPSEAQFELIKDAGYETVINLAPSSVLENSVVEERAILSRLGIEYVHIPVDFKHPTDADFDTFVERLRDAEPAKTWVHCAANMRVSAFAYRYRRGVLAENEGSARIDLHKIWEPVGVWKDFINQ